MKYALVTGATSGLGREIAIRLSESGWFVTSYHTGNVKICAVEKSPKSEIYAISNLFF